MKETCAAKKQSGESGIYEIRIIGHLDDRWSGWFDGFIITRDENGDTSLTGLVIDQTALHGLLNKVRDLGLPLRSVNIIESGQTNS